MKNIVFNNITKIQMFITYINIDVYQEFTIFINSKIKLSESFIPGILMVLCIDGFYSSYSRYSVKINNVKHNNVKHEEKQGTSNVRKRLTHI